MAAALSPRCDPRNSQLVICDRAISDSGATDKPRSTVTYVHRPKRPPRKKAQATVITGPAIVSAKNPKRSGPDNAPAAR
jgi:hypothetical protein